MQYIIITYPRLTFFWRAIYSSADIAGPEDIFLGPDGKGVEAAAGILLRELSNDGSGAVVVLVLGVANLEEGGDGLLPTFSKEPLDPKDWNSKEFNKWISCCYDLVSYMKKKVSSRKS